MWYTILHKELMMMMNIVVPKDWNFTPPITIQRWFSRLKSQTRQELWLIELWNLDQSRQWSPQNHSWIQTKINIPHILEHAIFMQVSHRLPVSSTVSRLLPYLHTRGTLQTTFAPWKKHIKSGNVWISVWLRLRGAAPSDEIKNTARDVHIYLREERIHRRHGLEMNNLTIMEEDSLTDKPLLWYFFM